VEYVDLRTSVVEERSRDRAIELLECGGVELCVDGHATFSIMKVPMARAGSPVTLLSGTMGYIRPR
jgi:hypothetical protein